MTHEQFHNYANARQRKIIRNRRNSDTKSLKLIRCTRFGSNQKSTEFQDRNRIVRAKSEWEPVECKITTSYNFRPAARNATTICIGG